MTLKLNQIETFYWIARLGSFHGAARRLNLTQPTLSVRIQELERALGASLFVREGRNVRLTPDGTALLSYAETMIALTGEIETRIGRRDPFEGLLRLGVPDSFAIVCLPALLRDLEKRHPRLEVEVTVDYSRNLAAMLDRRDIDMAFFMDAEVGRGIRVERLGPTLHAWMAAPGSDLPGRPATPADLVHRRILTNPRSAQLYQEIMLWFAAAGLEPRRVSTCNNLNVIARLTAGGVGISVLPVSLVREEITAGHLRAVTVTPPLPHSILYLGHPDGAPDPGIEAVVALARRHIARTGFLHEEKAA